MYLFPLNEPSFAMMDTPENSSDELNENRASVSTIKLRVVVVAYVNTEGGSGELAAMVIPILDVVAVACAAQGAL